jgi:hypothetical protein
MEQGTKSGRTIGLTRTTEEADQEYIYKWNPKRKDVREETLGGSGRQHWCEGCTRRQLRVKNEKTAGRIFEKTLRLQIAKREDGSSVGLLKIRNWTFWRGRSPKKEKTA